MKIIVTSGPTRSYIDEIRYISNYSTGELGTLIAKEAARKGYSVIQIAGKGSLTAAGGKKIKVVEIETVNELLVALKKELKNGKIFAVVHAMAVLDYVFKNRIKAKVKSEKKTWTLKFVRASKVIKEIKKLVPAAKLVGFKLEYKAGQKGLLASAKKLMQGADADYVVANDFSSVKAGKHQVTLIGKSGFIKGNIRGKAKIAGEIIKTLEGGK